METTPPNNAPRPRSPSEAALLEQGQTCWRRTRAHRARVLVDAERYFQWLDHSARAARHHLYIAGWDLHPGLQLVRQGHRNGPALADLLSELVRARPTLHVHVLLWDFSTLYLFERETLASIQALQFQEQTHHRVDFRLDSAHPVGASQHQKLVVVDDRVAYCGGIDLGRARWDTRDHAAEQPRRRDYRGRSYAPFHDVQMAVEGPPARALGALFRRRWLAATGEPLPEPPAEAWDPSTGDATAVALDPWPGSKDALTFQEVPCALARTLPEWNGRSEVREIEAIYLRSIASARQALYLENQYLTSLQITQALAARLREENGPEILLVTPRHLAGWLEEQTLGIRRRHMLEQLWAADVHGRFGVYTPRNAQKEPIYVHAKVAVVDDRLLQVGSANLSNRSLGLDSECDLFLEADGRSDLRTTIRRQRADLLAEHLGVPRHRVTAAIRNEGGLLPAVERLRGPGRSLAPLRDADLQQIELEIDLGLADPERPVAAEDFVKAMRWEEPDRRRWRALIPVLGALLWTLVLAALWRYTSLGPWLEAEAETTGSSVGAGLLGAGLTVGLFLVGGLLVVPVTLLVLFTAALYGPWLGVPFSLLGMGASTLLLHAIGRNLLQRPAIRLVRPDRAERIAQRIQSQRIWVFAALRLVPTAPFSLVNLVGGALDAPRFRFVVGTLLGSLPATVALAVLADQTRTALAHPWGPSIATAIVVGVGLLFALRWLRRRVTT